VLIRWSYRLGRCLSCPGSRHGSRQLIYHSMHNNSIYTYLYRNGTNPRPGTRACILLLSI
jgi:hypothetical protein